MQDSKSNFSFIKPAMYKIEVHGDMNASWTEKLGGLQITVERRGSKSPISTLIGQINDQSALSGVLTTLYENHLTIISVNMLKDEK